MSRAWAGVALAACAFATAPTLAQHAEHAQHAGPAPVDHAAMGHAPAAPPAAHTPVPPLTAADRAAAQPPASGHPAHDATLQSLVLFDRLEGWNDDGDDGLAWETSAWSGGDAHRLWLRSEGESSGGHTEGDVELLYGRPVARWWDLVAGVRHDLGDRGRDWAAIGVVGMTPYKFEFAATWYVGASGRTEAGLELEYETLLTNRLILQSSLAATVAGRADPARGLGSGLMAVEGGLRLRYEIDRRFAPYLGIERERAFGGTADGRRVDGEAVDSTRVVAGVRFWF